MKGHMNPHDKPPATIDELLEYPTSAEQMSDKELESFLRPYFPATRPSKLISALADKQERMSAAMTDEELLAKRFVFVVRPHAEALEISLAWSSRHRCCRRRGERKSGLCGARRTGERSERSVLYFCLDEDTCERIHQGFEIYFSGEPNVGKNNDGVIRALCRQLVSQ